MDDTELLIQALVDVWPELPPLVGDQWESFEGAILIGLRALEAAPPKAIEEERDALLALFELFPAAYTRLLEAYAARAPRVTRGATRAVPRIAGSTRHARYLEIPIFFATDRAPALDVGVDPFFAGERGQGNLTFGVARVSVPDDHRPGALEKPRWWKLQFRQDLEHFVIVLGVESNERAAFVARARDLIANAPLRDALIFIHGYNVSFADGARRAAQIAYDLNFEGLTMLYSWTSEGTTFLTREGTALSYMVDRGNAMTWSPKRFKQFLTLALTELGAASVHAIAHSMGNEVLVNGLETFDTGALPPGSAQLRQIIFAAPDVDATHFRELAEQFHTRAQRCTLYASSKDKALVASQALQKYARAGQAGDGIVIVDGVDTIDASELDTGFMSHSYIGDRTSILSDVHYLIRKDIPPDERYLTAVDGEGGRYWMFRPQNK
jgi:esterase/lipase superfamily enzyme